MVLIALRIATSFVWLAIMILGTRFAWRAVKRSSEIKPIAAVIAAVWLLALNRQSFAGVAQFDPGDDDALALCYIFALIAGLLMVAALTWARHDDR